MKDDPVRLHVPITGRAEREALCEALERGRFAGGGDYLARVEARLRERFAVAHVLATTSCSHALETVFAALELRAGDEVILPAYTHPSTANAVLRQGARPVYADILADGPHLDPADVERRITERTRVVVAVHYGGISRGTDELERLCAERGMQLVEDAAQAFDARDAGRACGTIGIAGCISFHATKNLGCGEGGCVLTDDEALGRSATVVREMGTDRARFRAGEVARYQWQALGSSFLPSELLMALLLAQLERADAILAATVKAFDRYGEQLAGFAERTGYLLPRCPPTSAPNGHVFHVIFDGRETRDAARAFLAERGIESATHFEPLDTSAFGRQFARGAPLENTQRIANGLLRLPLHTRLSEDDQARVVDALEAFASR